MGGEWMNLDELARYLRRDARQLARLAARGKIPARKVRGRWRFQRSEVLHWLESRIDSLSANELSELEHSGEPPGMAEAQTLILTPLMHPKAMAVPLQARSGRSVIEELVVVAERTGELWQPEVVLDAVLARERLHSTAIENGVALPHWRRPLPDAVARSLVVYGRSFAGIPFGSPHGGLTQFFFLLLCQDDATHLKVLARITRLVQQRDWLEQLAESDTPDQAFRAIEEGEKRLVHGA